VGFSFDRINDFDHRGAYRCVHLESVLAAVLGAVEVQHRSGVLGVQAGLLGFLVVGEKSVSVVVACR
jgi:hypothetical protein